MTNRFLATAVCLFAISFCGCALVGSKPDTKPDAKPDVAPDAERAADPEWLQNLKALKGTGESTGVSPEAREIERSLRSR